MSVCAHGAIATPPTPTPPSVRVQWASEMAKLAHSLSALLLLLSGLLSAAELDPEKSAELSRAIREQFRLSGMNWLSPRMLQVGWAAHLPVLHAFILSCTVRS